MGDIIFLNKILVLFIICLFSISGCYFLEIIKKEYADWESLINIPKNERIFYTPLFDGNISFKGKMFNIVVYYDLDSTSIYGKFDFKNDFLNDLPIQLKTFTKDQAINVRYKKQLKKMGFDDNKIEYYFYEILEWNKRTLYYFIDINKNIVYFASE